MSYIVTMGVAEGVIMAADRQITQRADIGRLNMNTAGNPAEQIVTKMINEKLAILKSFVTPLTRTARKLFTMGDNIGVSMGKSMYNESGIPMAVFVDYFCRTHTFDKPQEAAGELLKYLSNVGGNVDTLLHLAGYNRSQPEQLTPEMYHLDLEANVFSGGSDLAFNYGGFNEYFKPFSDRINDREAKTIFKYSLQDAVDIAKFAIDMSRFLSRYLDFEDAISSDIEMIAITHNGIQWLRKAGLEIRQ